MREASSLVLSARLLADGAHITAYDPVAEAEARKHITGVTFASSALEACDGRRRRRAGHRVAGVRRARPRRAGGRRWPATLIVDGRNFLDPVAVRGAGLLYEGIGRPSPA